MVTPFEKKTTGITSEKYNTLVEQKISKIYTRILFYGGATNIGDNATFEYAAKNVLADYKRHYPKDTYIFKFVDSAKTIVETINKQYDYTVASLDLFFHASIWALYIIKGASMSKNLSKERIEPEKLNAGLYGSSTSKLFKSSDGHAEIRTIYDIKFKKFITKGAVIEIHGCDSGGDHYLMDSITKNLSEEITEGYVIGHTQKANPNINGDKTTYKQQDYRHGARAIWKNGTVIKTTTKKGWINLSELK